MYFIFRYDYDDIFEVTPGCKRAVAMAREAIRREGFKVVHFRPRDLWMAWKLNSLYRQGDLGATKRQEHCIGPSSKITLGLRLLQWWPSLLRWIVGLSM